MPGVNNLPRAKLKLWNYVVDRKRIRWCRNHIGVPRVVAHRNRHGCRGHHVNRSKWQRRYGEHPNNHRGPLRLGKHRPHRYYRPHRHYRHRGHGRRLQTIFVTAASYLPLFTETPGQELALADAICQQEADIVGLPGTFVALLTTSLGAAHTRLGAAQGWRDPNGRPIANTPEDIASYRWLGYVEVSPSGVRSDWQFWGGGDGTADQTCQGWTSSDSLDSGKDMTFRLFSPEESTRTCDTPMPLACASIDYVDPIVVTPPNPHRLAFLSASPVVAGSNVTIMDGLCQLDFQNTFGPDTGRTFAALVAPALGTTPASRLAGLPDVPWIRADGVIIADTTTAFLDSDWHTFLQIRPDGTFFGEYTGETVIGGNGDLRSAATNATSCDGWTRTDSGQTFRPGKVGRWPAKTYYNARSCDSWLNVFLYCVETTP